MPIVLAYYCSGHGYGHATRVSAFTRHLLSLPVQVQVHIVSSAPALVFADSITLGAKYRYAEIDPVIVQPLAYRVDRAKSVQVLQHFLDKKDALVKQESSWLASINARAVLTDAAFLACLAASASSIPSVLLTNFTFDSVYSFLSTPLLDIPPPTSATLRHIPSLHHLPPLAPPSPARLGLDHPNHEQQRISYPSPLSLPPALNPQEEDTPIPLELLSPLTQQLLDGYTHAGLLVLLPGAIPIPSFPFPINVNAKASTLKEQSIKAPILPSSEWVDPQTRRTIENVEKWMKAVAPVPPLEMTRLTSDIELMANDVAPDELEGKRQKQRQREVIHAPLIVRPFTGGISSPSSSSVDDENPIQDPEKKQKLNPYTPEGRSALLKSISVPAHLHDHRTTKILVVSFGGQVFRCLPGSHHGSVSHSHGSHSHGSPHASPNRPQSSESQTHSRRTSREVSKEFVHNRALDVPASLTLDTKDTLKLTQKSKHVNGKEIDVLKHLDPNSIDVLSNKNDVSARRSQSPGLATNPNVNGSSVPGINYDNGDITMGAEVSKLQTGKMLTLPTATPRSPSVTSLCSRSPSPSPSPTPSRCCPSPPPRIATPSHIWIPGAPAPVPLAPLPFPPPLIETSTTATAKVRRRRSIAVGSTSTSSSVSATAKGSSRVVRVAFERERKGCKRSASMSVSVSLSSFVSRVGKKKMTGSEGESETMNNNIPRVVTIPPTPLPVDHLEFPLGGEKEKERTVCKHEEHERRPFVINGHTLQRREQADQPQLEFKDEPEQMGEGYTIIEDDHLSLEEEYSEYEYEAEGAGLIPDSSWITIVCGMSGSGKKEKNAGGDDGKEQVDEEDFLPEGFFVAPRDVYMPDLMAVADVLLGKLGYGTVSECVDACTPFIYVSRPLFIEEHGLRLLLDQQGVGVELSREAYEQGEWSQAVSEAWNRGKEAKEEKRDRQMELVLERQRDGGIGKWDKRQEEGRQLAGKVIEWVRDWWGEQMN